MSIMLTLHAHDEQDRGREIKFTPHVHTTLEGPVFRRVSMVMPGGDVFYLAVKDLIALVYAVESWKDIYNED